MPGLLKLKRLSAETYTGVDTVTGASVVAPHDSISFVSQDFAEALLLANAADWELLEYAKIGDLETAVGDVSDLDTTATDLTGAVNEVLALAQAAEESTVIGTLGSLTTTAKTDIVSAINEVDAQAGTAMPLAGGTFTGHVTMTTAKNIVLASAGAGTQIGTAANQKLGFYGATPAVQPILTADLKDALVALGLIADSGATPLNLDGGAITAGDSNVIGTTTITEGKNIVLGTTTGTKIGTGATQKLGFYNATPVVQPAVLAATKTDYTTADLDTEAELITAINATNTALNAVIAKLKALGLIASA